MMNRKSNTRKMFREKIRWLKDFPLEWYEGSLGVGTVLSTLYDLER